jgi:hypothetical protein
VRALARALNLAAVLLVASVLGQCPHAARWEPAPPYVPCIYRNGIVFCAPEWR